MNEQLQAQERVEKFLELREKYGKYEHNDKTWLALTQDPYAEINCYRAHAIDILGQEYNIYWDIMDQCCGNESDACDWDDYTTRRL